ncbi:uncharacterized protein BCR38DRAFT_527720 [Pseudomassariella vexata]|uniref:Rhodopsin domain-containing protein n=1 Tax=Pseudomassariella vexata TaxID=1141098 RepID=A0A1Y2DGH3_9PEZI|nr:uncharacterized protein BCR38DRAFT_527720 [Pseudomassariella vexata]ORY58184.1 hypothetical protein BCR38DRAFT_527720 [Pseudomassariella vexata]
MIVARAQPVLITSVLFTSLAFVTVCMRLYARVVLVRYAGADDYLMIASACASIGYMVVIIHQIKFGLGTHLETIPPENAIRFFQSLWATIPVYNLALVLCKLSIVFQYKRVFAITSIQKLCSITIGVLAVYGCWTVLGSTFMCIPVKFFWGEGEGTCMNRLAFWFSNAALNIASDLFIFGIPLPLLQKLQIPKTQKIILMVIFAFGLFVCITSIVRLRSLLDISVSPDSSFDGVNIAIWSGVEINVAIICSSVPALNPLIKAAFPRLLGSNGSTVKHTGRSHTGYLKHESDHPMQSMASQTKPTGIRIDQTYEVHVGQA